MPESDTVKAASTFHGTMINGEHNAVALTKRHNHRPRLHAGPLLGKHELSASEVFARLRQENRELERKNMFAVKILMQTVVVAGFIVKKKWSRFRLSGTVTDLDLFSVRFRKSLRDAD